MCVWGVNFNNEGLVLKMEDEEDVLFLVTERNIVYYTAKVGILEFIGYFIFLKLNNKFYFISLIRDKIWVILLKF